MSNDDLLKRFFNALPESARGGEDETRFYVKRSASEDQDLVANIRQYIQWSPPDSTYLLAVCAALARRPN